MPNDWSKLEVDAIVADYLHMLTMELAGQSYSKTRHADVLGEKLDNRSRSSIEYKHRNISAALIELGCPYISGYKPLIHHQQMLLGVVSERLSENQLFDSAALIAAEQPAVAPLLADLKGLLVDPPRLSRIAEPSSPEYANQFKAVKRDYLAREARNKSLGDAGELFVEEYEIKRLRMAGKRTLSERVERVSHTCGDGAGFDVLSFDESGRERFIEVKTTAFGKETPFYVTRNEISFAEYQPEQFHLYRLFEFRKQPRMFDLQGIISEHCVLDPVSYIARFS